MDGEFDSIPIPVDALGTAHQVVEIKENCGVDSPEYEEMYRGLVLDCEKLLAEAFRKNTWEHFGETEQIYDAQTSEYFAHGVSLTRAVTNGLTPIAEHEEQARRSNEYIEEETYRAIGHVGLKDISVQTISECTDWAIRDYKKDSKGSHGGYVPDIEKIMLRGVRFGGYGSRYEEQLGLPGLYITHDVIVTALREIEAVSEDIELTKTELHGKQFINLSNNSVVGLAKILDGKASEAWDKNIFMGEEVSTDHPKDYAHIAQEAELRRQQLAPKPRELADYLIVLEENGTDHWAAEGIVNAYLKKVLLEVARINPEQAELMFDKATADGFREVAKLQNSGQYREALKLLVQVEKNAPEVSFCGAGSCGLIGVNPHSAEAQKAKELGLKGDLLHDTDRACPSCHAKKVYYNMGGSKACIGCGNNEIR